MISLALLLAPLAAASDMVTSRAILEDPKGALTIADVVQRAMQPTGRTVSPGYSNSVYWMRVQVHAPVPGKIVLYILPNYLNEVRLYEVSGDEPMQWKTRVTGNFYPYASRDRASITPGFVVDQRTADATYYLRIKSRGKLTINVAALEPEEALQKDHQRDLLEVFFVTSMLFLLLWAIPTYLLHRQPAMGLFVIHQAVFTLFGVIVSGYLTPWVPDGLPHLLDWLNATLLLAVNFTCLLFVRALFKPFAPPRPLMRILTGLLAVFPILLVALLLGYSSYALIVSSLLTKFFWVLFAITAFCLRVERAPGRRLMQAFFLFILANNVLYVIFGHVHSVSPNDNLAIMQLLIMDGLIIGGSFALMLRSQAQQSLEEKHQLAQELLQAKNQVLAEQVLKHKIEVESQTDYLTGIPNRRRFTALAEAELRRSIRFQRSLTLLVIDIDHFKIVNDTWGHHAGDDILRDVSSLIGSSVREEDIFGRTGGDEFAAVIVETEGAGAFEIAKRLCDRMGDSFVLSGDGKRISVSISVGIAELKGRSIDFKQLMDEADEAMYRAKRAGRNQVCVND